MQVVKKIVTVIVMVSAFQTLTLISCSTIKKSSEKTDEVRKILVTITNYNMVYYKTIVQDLKKPIESYLKNYLLEFELCSKDIDSNSRKISKEEITFLKSKFKNQNIVRLDRLNPKLENLTKTKGKSKTSFVTIPIVFRNNFMAIYYSYTANGGGFNLLQKRNNKWEHICSNTVWIE